MSGTRRNIMLGTAGHVDHGKTALVKLLTGCETDTLADEKERGLTIDLGFAPCKLADNRVVGIVDVPGHVDFIRNMVAGAHGVDVVILVVAADDGIMPQTREHLQILTLMGLRHGLVALTKIDLVPPERREGVAADLRLLLAGTFLESAPICPLSNITGEGFDGFFDGLNAVVGACGERPQTGRFRMWVEDVFTIRGAGTVITGIPNRGTVSVEDTLLLQPAGSTGHVRRMQVYGQNADQARAGECVALNIPELEHQQARRGMLLGEPGSGPPATMAEVDLSLLPSLKAGIKDLCEAQFHIGTASAPVQVALLESAELPPGARQLAQLRWTEPLPVECGERFVLRANLGVQGQTGMITIGGGRVLGLSQLRLRRKRHIRPGAETVNARLEKRREALDDPARWCELVLQEAARPMVTKALEQLSGLSAAELQPLLETLRTQGRAASLPGGHWVASSVLDSVCSRMLALIQQFHAANPQRAGISREELFTPALGSPELCRAVADRLVQARKIEEAGTVVAAYGWRERLPEADQKLADRISVACQAAGYCAPAPAELATLCNQPQAAVDRIIRLLVDRAILVRLDGPLFIHRNSLESARRVALELFSKKPVFTTMEFRDALGVSRKYAVPLLDHLDKLRFTVRSGHDRTPGSEARKLLGQAR